MDTVNEWRTSPESEPVVPSNMPCQNGHAVDGVTAGKYDEILHGKICDCKRIKFSWEWCACDNGNILKHKDANE